MGTDADHSYVESLAVPPKSRLTTSDEVAQRSTPRRQSLKHFGSLINRFLLREPSALALDEFTKSQQKASAGRLSIGQPGISSQQLPQSLPKVNSKWDGLPTLPREKVAGLPQRFSTASTTSSRDSTSLSLPTGSHMSSTGNV